MAVAYEGGGRAPKGEVRGARGDVGLGVERVSPPTGGEVWAGCSTPPRIFFILVQNGPFLFEICCVQAKVGGGISH